MITTNIVNKYDRIFKAAYEILAEEATDAELATNPYWGACEAAEQMINLDAYFMSFGTLMKYVDDNAIGPFVLLPLDEPPFEINANTREIKVPEIFKRGVAVQGDCGSEILVFTVDRYFDYVDLNNMDIWIQYTTPAREEKAYKVDLFDRESIPGKIRFGWVLGPDVTNNPGALKFAVRFFKKAENNPSMVEYSLGTLSQTINIYSALQPIINETTDGYTNELFKKVITNSLDAGAIPADPPRFDTEPAINLPAVAGLENDELTLKVLATVSDNGIVSYQWYYSPTGTDGSFEVIAENDEKYVIEEQYIAVENPLKTSLITYYEEGKDDQNNPIWVRYDGDFDFSGESKTLYKRVQTLYIVPISELEKEEEEEEETGGETEGADGGEATALTEGADDDKDYTVTGYYRVSVRNSLDGTNYSNPVGSSVCKLPAPEILDVIDDLDYIKDSVALIDEKTLSVKVKIDTLAKATCTWKRISPSGAITTVEEAPATNPDEKGEVVFTFTPEAEGYYFAEITSQLNRTILSLGEDEKTNLIDSEGDFVDPEGAIPTKAVRATNTPDAPVLSSGHSADDSEERLTAENGIYEVNSYFIETELGPFDADKQNFVWKYQRADDTNPIVITKEFSSFVDGAVDESTINIKKNTLADPMIVWCESTNVLNGESSETAESPKFIVGF